MNERVPVLLQPSRYSSTSGNHERTRTSQRRAARRRRHEALAIQKLAAAEGVPLEDDGETRLGTDAALIHSLTRPQIHTHTHTLTHRRAFDRFAPASSIESTQIQSRTF